MPRARILEICDAAAALITAAWSPAAPNAVSVIYAEEVGLTKENAAALLPGRQVYLFPTTNLLDSVIDARNKLQKYSFGIVIAERYTDPGVVPDAWMDERVLFVQEKVLKPLSDLSVRLDGAWIDPRNLGGIDSVYSRDLLRKNKAFWSECSFTFQEVGA